MFGYKSEYFLIFKWTEMRYIVSHTVLYVVKSLERCDVRSSHRNNICDSLVKFITVYPPLFYYYLIEKNIIYYLFVCT